MTVLGITGSSVGASGTYSVIAMTGTVATTVEVLLGTSTSIGQLLFRTKAMAKLLGMLVLLDFLMIPSTTSTELAQLGTITEVDNGNGCF